MLVTVTGWSPLKKTSRRRRLAFQSLAAAATKYDISLVITSPKRLLGLAHFPGWTSSETPGKEWRRKVSNMNRQTVIYDAMYLDDLKAYQISYPHLLKAVAKQDIPMFNPVLPSKSTLYELLTQNRIRGGRLPRTITQVTPTRVIQILDESDRVWLKPVYGSGGRNIVMIDRLPNGRYELTAERYRGKHLHQEMDRQRLVQFIRQLTTYRQYMAQEHIELGVTREGRKVDFRVTVQRKDSGAWGVTATTARTGAAGSVLTNYHAGGRIRSLTNAHHDYHLLNSFGVTPSDLSHMNEFALRVARRLQSHYPRLGILGLDVGHTPQGEFYVYDFNGRPGRDILTDDEVVQFMDCVAGYAKYLSNRRLD
ncbi:YheC/YheD family protein [Alicyclobacillus ferrooxydans]|uniref:ATP-grasp domain-containing protein n=1 Tax=Alicyclobacillus ferrooxydans TaxID=471514 RepID=A0A0P9EHL3_9BACL|nr:YheC/YheD family protein [Alicyclobacillus ferrooxydans]KPV42135.1 hypothetical protein AN477_18975 [Alicyclobacillus ferrooxydans]